MTKDPCPHLEQMLPSIDAGLNRHTTVLYNNSIDIENTDKYWDASKSSSMAEEKQFTLKLRKAGLFEYEIQILSLRFMYNKTFADINTEMQFGDPRLIYKYYKRGLEKYKKYVKDKETYNEQ